MTKESKPKVTSADIKMALRKTFAAPGWQVFYEVGDDTGSRVRRHADAVAVGIWPSTGHGIYGFEIKVSRADWANEMKDPTKSWAIMQYCHRWGLVTPPGLVKADELPDNWGLMTFDGKSMRTVKQAPKLTPVPLTPGFVAAIVRRAGERDDAVIASAEERGRALERERMERMRAEQPITAWEANNLKRRVEEAEATVAKIKEVLPDLSTYNIDQYAHAIKAVRGAGISGHYNGIVGLLNTLESSAKRLREHYVEAGFSLPERGVE